MQDLSAFLFFFFMIERSGNFLTIKTNDNFDYSSVRLCQIHFSMLTVSYIFALLCFVLFCFFLSFVVCFNFNLTSRIHICVFYSFFCIVHFSFQNFRLKHFYFLITVIYYYITVKYEKSSVHRQKSLKMVNIFNQIFLTSVPLIHQNTYTYYESSISKFQY